MGSGMLNGSSIDIVMDARDAAGKELNASGPLTPESKMGKSAQAMRSIQTMGSGILNGSSIDLVPDTRDQLPVSEVSGAKELFVYWLVDAYSLESLLNIQYETELGQQSQSQNNISLESSQASLFQMIKNKEKDELKTVPVTHPFFIRQFSTPELTFSTSKISSITLYTNDLLQKDQLILACPDGSLRIHTLSESGSITNALPTTIQLSDPESRTQLSTVCPSHTHNFEISPAFCKTKSNAQFVLGLSSEGNLSILDINESTLLLDMLILTNRKFEKPLPTIPILSSSGAQNIAQVALAAGRARRQLTAAGVEFSRMPKVAPGQSILAGLQTALKTIKRDESRKVRVVDPERGLFLLWAGREWSLMKWNY
ncbi:hypothetical protein HDU98_001890 [Podochytrium sp. JEL0797]|nr:hypothetical protein HDU98_001890 [Podochytrium sp. JEL0797]